MAEFGYSEYRLCLVSLMLSVTHAECHIISPLCWVSVCWMLLCWVSWRPLNAHLHQKSLPQLIRAKTGRVFM